MDKTTLIDELSKFDEEDRREIFVEAHYKAFRPYRIKTGGKWTISAKKGTNVAEMAFFLRKRHKRYSLRQAICAAHEILRGGHVLCNHRPWQDKDIDELPFIIKETPEYRYVYEQHNPWNYCIPRGSVEFLMR